MQLQLRNLDIKGKALAITIFVHALVIFFLLYYKFTLPEKAVYEETGMEVNLGSSADGSGEDQPLDSRDPAASNDPDGSNTAEQSSSGMNEIERSDDPDAPSVAPLANSLNRSPTTTRLETNKQAATDRTSDQQKTQRQTPKYTYAGATGKGGNSATADYSGTSEGNTTGTGDRGVPGGTPGAQNYEGSPGAGNGGISHTLSGRDISPSRFEAAFREGGKVTVRVTVDKDGNILEKVIKSSPNKELSAIALQKLAQAKFSRSPNAEPEQFGTITIYFKARAN